MTSRNRFWRTDIGVFHVYDVPSRRQSRITGGRPSDGGVDIALHHMAASCSLVLEQLYLPRTISWNSQHPMVFYFNFRGHQGILLPRFLSSASHNASRHGTRDNIVAILVTSVHEHSMLHLHLYHWAGTPNFSLFTIVIGSFKFGIVAISQLLHLLLGAAPPSILVRSHHPRSVLPGP
jgi:hypothetical protein